MEIIKPISKWGNSAGVLLPREWIGKEAKIVLIDRTADIQSEVFKILDKKLSRILGIYLVGSYARNEQNNGSDIDILAISDNLQDEIISGKYHISIIKLDSAKNAIKKSPILILPRLIEARPLLNTYLLNELIKTKPQKKSFLDFILDSKRMMKISSELIALDKLDSEYLQSTQVIYSLILRLRSLFLIKCILSNKKYTNKDFLSYLSNYIDYNSSVQLYRIYKDIKADNDIKEKISIETSEKLLNILDSELKKW